MAWRRVASGAAEQAAITEAVGDLRGRDVLHLQCHIGFDAIAFARRGARVTALDFSAASLEKARALGTRCGVEVEWVHADVTRLPAALKQRFDFVYATIGCAVVDRGRRRLDARGRIGTTSRRATCPGRYPPAVSDDRRYRSA